MATWKDKIGYKTYKIVTKTTGQGEKVSKILPENRGRLRVSLLCTHMRMQKTGKETFLSWNCASANPGISYTHSHHL